MTQGYGSPLRRAGRLIPVSEKLDFEAGEVTDVQLEMPEQPIAYSSTIQQGLRDKKILTAQRQLVDAKDSIKSATPAVGGQKEQLAAGQLAIALANTDGAPQLLRDRLEELIGLAYDPKDMVEIVLTDREKAFLPAAQIVCGLLLDKAAEVNA